VISYLKYLIFLDIYNIYVTGAAGFHETSHLHHTNSCILCSNLETFKLIYYVPKSCLSTKLIPTLCTYKVFIHINPICKSVYNTFSYTYTYVYIQTCTKVALHKMTRPESSCCLVAEYIIYYIYYILYLLYIICSLRVIASNLKKVSGGGGGGGGRKGS